MWSKRTVKILNNPGKNNLLVGSYLIKSRQIQSSEIILTKLRDPLPPGEKWFSVENKTDTQRSRTPENKNISWVFPVPEKSSVIH